MGMIDVTNGREVIEEVLVYDRVRAAYARDRACVTGGWVFREGQVEVQACPFVDRLNGLLSPMWPEEEVPALWRRALSLYRETGQGMFISFGPLSSQKPLQKWIEESGGERAGSHFSMYLELENLREFAPLPELRIERIDDFSFFEKQKHPWLGATGAPFRDLKLHFLREAGEAYPPRLWQFVALYRRQLAGWATVYIQGDKIAFFDVVVAEPFRRIGIGTQLMVEACKRAGDSGIRAAGLATDSEAGIELYRKIGFVSAGIYQDFFIDAEDLEKKPLLS